jgi:hypothetical protein
LIEKLTAILMIAFVLIASAAEARESHGGHYAGGFGRSHWGGHYRNVSTGNHYTHHRR